MSMDRSDWERLKEIQDTMGDLLEEAKNIVRLADKHEYERCKAYWATYIENAIDGRRSPLLPCTMGDTIFALNNGQFADEMDEDDEEEVEDDNE